MSESTEKPTLEINGVPIESTFAEAFDMTATRVIVTADDVEWVNHAAAAMTGFGTSVIACGAEIDVERELSPSETPDGRPGVSILAFAVSGTELEKQITRRAGQCILTCPTTALYAGIEGDRTTHPKRISLGKTLRYFGDGNQISKVTGGNRYWRIPVMDGEFLCQHDVARVPGVGGGNFLLMADSIGTATIASRAAVKAMRPLADIIMPFPGGTTRSGSKVGSKYPALFASTNDAYCPALRATPRSAIGRDVQSVIEVVIDGLSADAIAHSMRVGIDAACQVGGGMGLLGVTAGHYGGKLGRHHFHLHEVMA